MVGFHKDDDSLCGKEWVYKFCINWSVARDFSEEIEAAVLQYYGDSLTSNRSTMGYSTSSDTYTLRDSSPITGWDDSYANYNCYAYALGITDEWYVVGFSQGLTSMYYYYNGCPSIEDLNDYLQSDLASEDLGYSCISLRETVPTSATVPSGATAICLRSCEYDFHFMVLDGSTWCHKPSSTIPLVWNYSSPEATVWTNEYADESGHHKGQIEYDSTIYYYVIREAHYYDTYFAHDHYHKGEFHHYYLEEVCNNCGTSHFRWIIRPCSGPPCSLEYMSVSDQMDIE